MKKCNIPPKGWLCTRQPGHEGPCAAYKNVRMPHPFLTVAGDLVIVLVIVMALLHGYKFIEWVVKLCKVTF